MKQNSTTLPKLILNGKSTTLYIPENCHYTMIVKIFKFFPGGIDVRIEEMNSFLTIDDIAVDDELFYNKISKLLVILHQSNLCRSELGFLNSAGNLDDNDDDPYPPVLMVSGEATHMIEAF